MSLGPVKLEHLKLLVPRGIQHSIILFLGHYYDSMPTLPYQFIQFVKQSSRFVVFEHDRLITRLIAIRMMSVRVKRVTCRRSTFIRFLVTFLSTR